MSLFFRAAEGRSMKWWSTGESGPPGTISDEKATYLTPVFAAIRHIVDYGSTLPVKAYRRTGGVGEDTRERVVLPAVFRREQNQGRPGVGQWFGECLYGMVTRGNSVGWIAATDGYGYPTAIDWIRHQDWQYDELTRQWWVLGARVSRDRIFHVPWIVPPGETLGLSPIGHAMAMVKAGLSAQEYADISRGGGIPPTQLKNEALETIDPEVSAEIARRAARRFQRNEPFVTGKDWTLDVTEIPPNHAQFIETMKMSANQIAAIYGIDPREIGGDPGSSLTYFTDESRPLNRAHNIRPYLTRIEDAVERYMPERQFIRLNVDATLRADSKTRTDVVGQKLKDGRLNVDEARALDDLPPLPNGQGQFHNVPAPKTSPSETGPEDPAARKEVQP